MADNLHAFGPGNVETLLTTTIEKRRGDIKNAIINKLSLFDHLNKKHKVTLTGGTSIVTPVMYGKNNTVDSYNGFDTIDTTPQDGHTSTQYEIKQYAGSLSLSGRELSQNRGPEAIHNLVNAKQMQLEKSLADKLNQDLFASSVVGDAMNTLVTTIDATSTIGEINSTTYSWWQSHVGTGGSFATDGLADMRIVDGTLGQRGARPTAWITTMDIFNFYEKELQDQIRYVGGEEAEGSFKNLLFRGVPVIHDAQATSGVMYAINSDAMELVFSSDKDFSMTEWVKPANQDAKVAQMLCYLQLVVNNRRLLGKITSITA